MNTEHMQQCADAGYAAYSQDLLNNGNAGITPCVAFAQAAISTYLKLNPVWVRASERMPTREDADRGGWVATCDNDSHFSIDQWNVVGGKQLWCGLKGLPPPPDPFEDWFAKQPDDVRAADKKLVRKIYNSIKP